MLEDEGHWIKLMRTATLPTDANICLRISGRDIVCTVTKDVNKEVELKVTCRFADTGDEQELDFTKYRSTSISTAYTRKSKSEICSDNETQVNDNSNVMLDFVSEEARSSNENMSSRKSEERSHDVTDEKISRSGNIASDSDCGLDDANEVTSSTVHESPSSDEKLKNEEDGTRMSPKSSEAGAEHRNILSEEGASYRCHFCDFPFYERHAFEQHVRSHHETSAHRTTSSLTNPRSFCDACKIQFMSVNTYQVHKKYYCKSRHESEEFLPPGTVLEGSSNISSAFRPSSDTVILRGGINGSMAPSIIQPQAIYAAISTNPLILLPCSLVSGQGLVPQNGVIPTGGPGIVLQTGIACPTIVEKPSVKVSEDGVSSHKISNPEVNVIVSTTEKTVSNTWKNAPIKRKMSEGDVLNLKKSCVSEDRHSPVSETPQQDFEKMNIEQESPLDLSLKKKKVASLSPMKRRNSSASMGRPSPPLNRAGASGTPPGVSIVHGTVSPSNSYSNESNSCYASHVPVVVQRISQTTPERISPLPPVLQAAVASDKPLTTPGMLPPKLLKQGNNICEECHIVFYKYDNYLAHKKHYCAYRRQQLSALAAAAAAAAASAQHDHSSDDNNSDHSGGNDPAPGHPDDPSKPAVRRVEYAVDHFRPVITKHPQSVYCCDACGVKFSTQDNLNAHQTYYCIKKTDSAMSKANKKGDGDGNQKAVESPFLGPEEWKCNYCEVTGSSYEVIRRHLLTHTELRGFRCLVCGYKGNTWRGMRTHACEHLTEDGTSLEEFMSSTVITESGGIPVMSRAVDCSDEDSDASRDIKSRERTSSNTSESMKETSLLRRELLATDHSGSEELSSSPRNVEHIQKDSVPKRVTPIKAESGESSSDANAHQEQVNPLAFCDVVIKTENDHSGSGDDGSRDRQASSAIKFEQESDYDSDERHRDGSASPPTPSRSVIRVASDIETVEDRSQPANPSKRKGRSQTKPNIELKYCKSCDISFYHLSNFLAHKKYYCVSRVIQNCLPEAATVQ